MYPCLVRCFKRLLSAGVTTAIPKPGSRKTVRIDQSLDKPICTSEETTGPRLGKV